MRRKGNQISRFVKIRKKIIFYNKIIETLKKGKPQEMPEGDWSLYKAWAKMIRPKIIEEVIKA